ncbi:uncharacterized protein LOC119401226 [Rhipicephalus sanguineus]|uniref:uncharacterized protein LOC119401226 n=1 Tax=Rhipicephalus sanguineus TaxID=34632 RepID=UPI001893C623|nr:uncharacterized protein LOC119401226 [Rhipicephalus sanguineus]
MAQLERYIACVILVLAGISCVESRKDYHPHLCSGFFIGPQPQNPCGYLCYTFEGVFQGILSDGARCRPSPFFGRHGRCYRGECIVQRPKIRQCDDVYRGSGYAPSCRYRCVDPFGQLVIRPYQLGTPCLNLNRKKRPVGAAGVCKAGQCIEYDDLEVRSRWVMENVFQYKYHRCLAKKQVTKNYLWDCHHYCKRNKVWYFGVYQDGSRCLNPDTRAPGFCCHGVCNPTECKRKK